MSFFPNTVEVTMDKSTIFGKKLTAQEPESVNILAFPRRNKMRCSRYAHVLSLIVGCTLLIGSQPFTLIGSAAQKDKKDKGE
jgi:hypothetical protein